MGIVYTTLRSSSGCGIPQAIWKAFSNCDNFRQQSHTSPATSGPTDQKHTTINIKTGLCAAFVAHSLLLLHRMSSSKSPLLPQRMERTAESPTADGQQTQQQPNAGASAGASGSQHTSPSKIKTQVSPAGICACIAAYFKVT